jgi:hypothetical protein
MLLTSERKPRLSERHEIYLDLLAERFIKGGFEVRDHVQTDELDVELAARKSGTFQLMSYEAMFVVAHFQRLDLPTLNEFMIHTMKLGIESRSKQNQLLGLFPIAIVNDPDDLAIEEVEWADEVRFPEYKAISTPIIYDLRYDRLHYFQEVKPLDSFRYSARELIYQFLV